MIQAWDRGLTLSTYVMAAALDGRIPIEAECGDPDTAPGWVARVRDMHLALEGTDATPAERANMASYAGAILRRVPDGESVEYHDTDEALIAAYRAEESARRERPSGTGR